MRSLREVFNENYRAAWPPEVLTLMDMIQGPEESLADYDARMQTAAAKLQAKGVLIDKAIMIWRWTAYDVMEIRSVMGLPWVGSLNTGTDAAAGSFPWPKGPSGTLPTVFVDPSDAVGTLMRLRQLYPPLPPPVAPVVTPPAPPVGLVGFQSIFGPYVANIGAINAFHAGALKDGQRVSQDGKEYIFHVIADGQGFNFTLAPPA